MNHNKSSFYPYFIWAIGALFYAYEVCLQISPGVMVPELMKAFNVTGVLLGNMAAFYFYSYTFMQIPSGLLLDYYGPRKVMTIALFLCALGSLIFGLAKNLHYAELGRLIIGIGSAFAIIGTFKLISIWFNPRNFAFMAGLTLTVGMTGAVGAGAPLAFAIEQIGWRANMHIFAILGFIIMILTWIYVRDTAFTAQKNPGTIPEVKSLNLLSALKKVILKLENWTIAIYGGLVFAPTSAFAGLWGVPFIMSAYGVSRPAAGSAISMCFIGWIVGSPLFGKISDHLQRRKVTLLISSIGTLISFYACVYIISSYQWVYIWLFLFGFFSSAFLPSFSIIQEINPSETNATAMGYMNTLNMIGGAVLQPLLGWLLDLHWTGQMLDGARMYSVSDFQNAFKLIVGIIALSIVFYFFIPETYCRSSTQKLENDQRA